ncbi:MAG: hypothetical protein GEV28_01120 [Actinophytocola sp.]|nr:hypothetical protein [Actinophytocola sp.]
MASEVEQPVIVVGVDGSPGSVEALRWAAGQAELIGATLHVLIAWRLPEMYSYTSRDFTAEAGKTLNDAIKKALGAQQRVPIVPKVVEERPAVALIQAAREARLLVVGSRGSRDVHRHQRGQPEPRCETGDRYHDGEHQQGHGGDRDRPVGEVARHCDRADAQDQHDAVVDVVEDQQRADHADDQRHVQHDQRREQDRLVRRELDPEPRVQVGHQRRVAQPQRHGKQDRPGEHHRQQSAAHGGTAIDVHQCREPPP